MSTLLTSDSGNGSSSSTISRPQLRGPIGPSSRTASTPSRHCSAGGITSRFQMYSPITSSTFLASILVGQVEIRADPLDVKRAARWD